MMKHFLKFLKEHNQRLFYALIVKSKKLALGTLLIDHV